MNETPSGMNRNQLLLTLGVVGTLCVLFFSCALVTAGAFFLRDTGTTTADNRPTSRATSVPGQLVPEGDEDPTTPRESNPGPATKDENVLTLPGGEPPTLDPHLTSDATSAGYIVEIFSGLVALDQELKIKPDIAKNWEISEDGKTYTFSLRDDAKFADGKAITANDFKYSFERACDPDTESPVADTYLGDIVGCREKLQGSASEVSGVRVVDDHTLAISIEAPIVYFLSKLTYPTAYVVDREAVENGGRDWSTNDPNGSGPFALELYTFGEEIILVPNPNYYGSPKPTLDRVIYALSGGSAMTRYETGELDITGVTLADIDRVLDPQNPLNLELKTGENMGVFYIGLNSDQPPFDDPKVRQAFNMAVDKNALANVVLRDTVTPAERIVPPGMPDYDAEPQPLAFNPEEARKLLDESKYAGNLPEITLHTSGVGGAPPSALEALVEMWRQNLDIEVAIEQTEFATFLFDINREPNPYQMYFIGWIADYPDPQDFLDILFHCDSHDNHSGYCSQEVNTLLEQARVERDQQKRYELYGQAEQIILNDGAWIPLWFSKDYALIKPYVEGYDVPPAIIPMLQYVSIKQ
jgi:oligopeptide transport system substrate-binding protein